MNLTYEQALNKAAALCSQSEKCPQDILQKCIGWGLSEDEATRIVDRLTEENFLSEERFAKAFVNDKFRFEHWGRVKISFALRGKGICDSAIREAIDEKIDPDEYAQSCADLLQTKLKGMEQPLSQNDRAKLYRFMAQRGFETSVVSRALAASED